jgi:hypothetical protein
VPTPGAIEVSVALLTDHRSVEDWPRSIVEGSALNCEIAGFGGGGGGGFTGGGGGGGGGATGFLHPDANRNRENPNNRMLILRFFILNFAS